MNEAHTYSPIGSHNHISLRSGGHSEKISWFTLTELIVVISVLAILGLIAFVSFAWYVSSARDATRASDIANLSQGMELAVVKNGAYPTPDRVFTVAYSGGSVWSQGTAGEGVFQIMDNAGARFSKKFTDPLLGTEYGYATLAYDQAYQFRADWEGDTVARVDPSFVDSAYAASGNPTIAYIKGNYAGYVATTMTGGKTCVLGVPSLIVSQSGAALTGSVDFMSLSDRFLMHGYSNTQGVKFTPQPGVCFSELPTDDSWFGITNIMQTLQKSYSGSNLVSDPNVSGILSSQSGALVTVGIPIIEAGLGIDIVGAAYPDPSVYSSGTVYSPMGNSSFVWGGTTVHVTGSGIGFASSRADPLCDTNDIAIWSGTTNNVQIWSACNVGATVASAGTTTQACSAGCSVNTFTGTYAASLANFGSYFQWGNNTPVTYLSPTAGTGSRSTTCSGTNNSTYSGATNFILSDLSLAPVWDWCTSQNDNLWGNSTDNPLWTNLNARRWPCPSGYHVPTGGTTGTGTDWGMLYTSVYWNTTLWICSQSDVYDRIQCVLMLPYAGYRPYSDGLYMEQGRYAEYLSSSPVGTRMYAIHVVPKASGLSSAFNRIHYRASALPVRCIKN